MCRQQRRPQVDALRAASSVPAMAIAFCLVWSCLVSSWSPAVAAETTPPARQLSPYEQQSLALALAEIDGQVDANPEGKRIESIEVVRLEVIEARDPAPAWLNNLHFTTQRSVIEREVLLKPGEVYDARRVDETERNLRDFPQLSVVLVVPVKATTSNQVRLLVVTKDVWSLRVSWEPTLFNGKLTGLYLQPSETNLFGTTHMVSARVSFTPNTYWVGGSYSAPRIGGSRISSYLTASVGFNCLTHELEGTTGYFRYGQPLYSSTTRWSWLVAASWQDVIQQPYAGAGSSICSGGPARSYPVPTGGKVLDRQGEDEAWAIRNVVLPYRFREGIWRGQTVVTRSFFEVDKLDLSFGLELDARAYSSVTRPGETIRTEWTVVERQGDVTRVVDRAQVATSPEQVDAARAWFVDNVLPETDRRLSPYAQLHAYRSDYRPIVNYQTLGLQEAYQAGHNVYLRLYPGLRPLSSRNLVGLFSGASYTWPVSNGFLSVMGSSQLEYSLTRGTALTRPNVTAEPRVDPRGAALDLEQSDLEFQGTVHWVSPSLFLGRLVSNAQLLDRPSGGFINRYAYVLGGTDQLRGYRASAFLGRTRFALNTEFRTRPLQIFSVLTGLNFFWDAGDAADQLSSLVLKHGAGVGLRFLFPQLDRQAFRIDFGFPLQPHQQGEFTWFAGFARVFDTPAPRPPSLLPQ
jgi:hypothetical protein